MVTRLTAILVRKTMLGKVLRRVLVEEEKKRRAEAALLRHRLNNSGNA